MALREGHIEAIATIIDPVISLLEFRGEIRVLSDTRSMRGTHDLYGGRWGGCLMRRRFSPRWSADRAGSDQCGGARAEVGCRPPGRATSSMQVPEAYMHGDRAIYLAALGKAREAMSPDGMTSTKAWKPRTA